MLTTDLKNIRGSRCLVAGGSGFIGRHLTKLLLALGAGALLILHKNKSRVVPARGAVKFVQCDLGASSSLKIIKDLGPLDYIFNLCGVIDKRVEDAQVEALIGANIGAVINLTRALNWELVKGAVHVGSCAEYGNQAPPHLENLPAQPTNPYSWSKAAGTSYAKLAARGGYAKWSLARPFLVYGPGQEPGGSLVINVLEVLAKGGEFILSDPQSTRDFIFVEDVARALVALVLCREAAGEIFNICSGEEVSVIQVANLVRDAVQKGQVTVGSGSRAGNFLQSYGSFQKIMNFTGWRPEIKLKAGLKLTIDAYQQKTVS